MGLSETSWESKGTWKVLERSWSPSWTNWSMGKVTEILFSLVREAMGNERVTTCSPTAGGRATDKEQGLDTETGISSGLSKCIISHPVGRWACPWRWAGRWWGRWRPRQAAEADLPSALWPPRDRQGSGGLAWHPSPAPHRVIVLASAVWAVQRQEERRRGGRMMKEWINRVTIWKE